MCRYQDDICLLRSSNLDIRRYGKTGLPEIILEFLILKVNTTGRAVSDIQNFRLILKFSLTADEKAYAKIYKLTHYLDSDLIFSNV